MQIRLTRAREVMTPRRVSRGRRVGILSSPAKQRLQPISFSKKEGNPSTCRQQSYGRTGSVDRESSPRARRLAKFTRGDLPSALGKRRRRRCPTPRAIRNPTLCLVVQGSPYACLMSGGSCPTVINRTIIHNGLRNNGIGG